MDDDLKTVSMYFTGLTEGEVTELTKLYIQSAVQYNGSINIYDDFEEEETDND